MINNGEILSKMHKLTFLIPAILLLLSMSSLSSAYAQHHKIFDQRESVYSPPESLPSVNPSRSLQTSLSPDYSLSNQLDKGAIAYNATGIVLNSTSIRDAPPHGIFNLFVGQEIIKVTPGMKLNIIGRKTYAGFLGTHVWYQLAPSITIRSFKSPDYVSTDKLSNVRHQNSRWVYGGIDGYTKSVNIQSSYSTPKP